MSVAASCGDPEIGSGDPSESNGASAGDQGTGAATDEGGSHDRQSRGDQSGGMPTGGANAAGSPANLGGANAAGSPANLGGAGASGEAGDCGGSENATSGAGGEAGAGALHDTAPCQATGATCRVWATGNNQYGQLGDGTSEDKSSPVAADLPSNVIAISAGYDHSLALLSDRRVWAWGRNTEGELGDGSTENRFTPAAVSGVTDVIAVSGGTYHSVAVQSDGSVWTWGAAEDGRMGDGVAINPAPPRLEPARVEGLPPAISASAGWGETLVLTRDHTVWIWGTNDYYTVDATQKPAPTPRQKLGLSNIVEVAAGYWFNCALDDQGLVWCWGLGTTGVGGNVSIPTIENGAQPFQSLALPYGNHLVALDSSGHAWAWGENSAGGVLGEVKNASTVANPTVLAAPANVLGVAAGHGFSIAYQRDGAWVWGRNDVGQLGLGTTSASAQDATPVTRSFENLPGAIASVMSNGEHTLLLLQSP